MLREAQEAAIVSFPFHRSLIVLGGVVLLVAGCKSALPALTPEQAEGQRLYKGRCAHCHEENDLALKPPPPQLNRIFDRGVLPASGLPATDPEVRRTILQGKGNMPSFAGRFTPDQLENLIAYLHTGLR